MIRVPSQSLAQLWSRCLHFEAEVPTSRILVELSSVPSFFRSHVCHLEPIETDKGTDSIPESDKESDRFSIGHEQVLGERESKVNLEETRFSGTTW